MIGGSSQEGGIEQVLVPKGRVYDELERKSYYGTEP